MRQPIGNSLRPYRVLLAVSATVVGVAPAAPALAQQGWAPVVVSSIPGPESPPVANRALSGGPRMPAQAPERQSAVPALMDVATQRRPLTDAPPPIATRAAKPTEVPAFTTGPARAFCVNIADAAADAKFAWQKRTLTDLQQDLDKRIVRLEAKTAELQQWVARRDEFSKKAHASLVTIYARMRPDAAAMQLSQMDEETAAAVLVKLDARLSSAILNEMEPGQAARLTATIAGAAKVPLNQKSMPEDKRS
jgi:flagellar motility protein MotE (MotC chaperone)